MIVPLAKIIEQYLLQFGPRSFLFKSLLGGPVSVEYIAREVIKPTLQALGMESHGWHPLRRGLATNLHALGVSDIVIQAILRHSGVLVTRQSYISRRPRFGGYEDPGIANMHQTCTRGQPAAAQRRSIMM